MRSHDGRDARGQGTDRKSDSGGHGAGGHRGHAGHGQGRAGHGGHDHAAMVADFRRRLWVSLALTVPVLVLAPMIQRLLGLREALAFPGEGKAVVYVLIDDRPAGASSRSMLTRALMILPR